MIVMSVFTVVYDSLMLWDAQQIRVERVSFESTAPETPGACLRKENIAVKLQLPTC